MDYQSISEITESFRIEGTIVNAAPYGNGHIHDTYLVTTTSGKHILQKINHQIFTDVDRMNRNIIKALEQLHHNQIKSGDHRFKELKIIPSKEGKNHFRDEKGQFWRMMNFIGDSFYVDVVDTPQLAYEAAKAFGYFQKNLLAVDPGDFYPTIKEFHNLKRRLSIFRKIVEENPTDRNKIASREIEIVEKQEFLGSELQDLLENKTVPIRVTHNDTKINNVLFDKNSKKGVAVIDLDTVMPGTILYDFGDMIRTFSSGTDEDEKDLSRVGIRFDVFKAMAAGYLSELKECLTQPELENLVFGGKVMTFMIGLRFLTDFLAGDIYYKTSHPGHNLDRCRVQFRLLEEIEGAEHNLKEVISAM